MRKLRRDILTPVLYREHRHCLFIAGNWDGVLIKRGDSYCSLILRRASLSIVRITIKREWGEAAHLSSLRECAWTRGLFSFLVLALRSSSRVGNDWSSAQSCFGRNTWDLGRPMPETMLYTMDHMSATTTLRRGSMQQTDSAMLANPWCR